MEGLIGLIGLGAVGAPIAHKLYRYYGDDFVILSDKKHADGLRKMNKINGEAFNPKIVTYPGEIEKEIAILIVAVKNYDLKSTCSVIEPFISDETVLVPLQNGIWACRYLRNNYSLNIVAECYVRGPNTRRVADGFVYTNSGVVHIGISLPEEEKRVKDVFKILKKGGLDIRYEKNIKRMVWKKWMLNVAGNTVTALTGANYKMFADSLDMQLLCRSIMQEFLLVADKEGVELTANDIDETIDYFVGFPTEKITSMLEDVQNERQTENEYITGELLRMGQERGIPLPVNKTMYMVVKLKEYVYTRQKEERQQ